MGIYGFSNELDIAKYRKDIVKHVFKRVCLLMGWSVDDKNLPEDASMTTSVSRYITIPITKELSQIKKKLI